jgi:hypothetical protein
MAPGGGLPPAGWHPDPAGSRQERWWSGADWTDHLRDVAHVAPSPPPEPEEYQPMGGWQAGNLPQPYVAPTGSPNTLPIWLIAFSPLLTLAAVLLVLLAHLPTSEIGIIAFIIGVIVVTAGLVFWDNALLSRRNLPVASPLWLLLSLGGVVLGLIAYVIARSVKLRHAAPGVVFAVVFVASILGFGIVIGAASYMASSNVTSSTLESQISTALTKEAGSEWTVDCPESLAPYLTGSTFTCSAQDVTGRALTITIKVSSASRYEIVSADETPVG